MFKEATEHQITERLGDGFSRPVFATVVVRFKAFVAEYFSGQYVLPFSALRGP